tara:strand:+ start:489 stop:1466 length:978 start_codon:yes stop_codon:yes gene_type:complete
VNKMKTSFNFSDPLELSEKLSLFGQATRITQLDDGPGTYEISASENKGISLAQISASKTLLYEGWGNGRTVDFNWVTPLSSRFEVYGYCDGYEMRPNSLAGFGTINPSPRNAWGKYSSDCLSTACMVDKERLMNLLSKCKAYDALDRLNNQVGMHCNNDAFHQIRKLAKKDLNAGIINSSKYFDLIVACLEESDSDTLLLRDSKNINQLREIVYLAHDVETMSDPLTLSQVCAYIDSSQASLYRTCQEFFGMGIIELMTHVRMEESRRVLLNKELRQNLRLYSIRDVAIRYGFKHQGRYARRYFTSFGELPSQTIERSRDYSIEY